MFASHSSLQLVDLRMEHQANRFMGCDYNIEACFRRMKTTGLRIRPVYHWTAHRITSHVRLCVLALLLERAAEIRVGDTWRNLRFALEEVKAVRYRVHGITLVQSTRLTAQVMAYLKKLGVKPPPRVLSIENSSAPL